MQADLQAAAAQHTGWVYFTDDGLPNLYDSLPSAKANKVFSNGSWARIMWYETTTFYPAPRRRSATAAPAGLALRQRV